MKAERIGAFSQAVSTELRAGQGAPSPPLPRTPIPAQNPTISLKGGPLSIARFLIAFGLILH